MVRRWFALSVLPVLATGLIAPGSAQADTPPPSFAGELFESRVVDGSTGEHFQVACNEDGSGTVSWQITGTATGPYPGTFTETGSLTFGPVVDGEGTITSLSASFQVESSAGTVDGNKTLLPADNDLSRNEGFCDLNASEFYHLATVQLGHAWEVTITTADSVYKESGDGVMGGYFKWDSQFEGDGYELIEDFRRSATGVVFVAPRLPTTEEQCKNGGWQQYGVFKNQGECVSYVATHGKNSPTGS